MLIYYLHYLHISSEIQTVQKLVLKINQYTSTAKPQFKIRSVAKNPNFAV